ncbi:hypothetical protein ACOMHN_064497 [Nucella lapillus]
MASIRVVRAFSADKKAISLVVGSPGPETLKDCKDILLKATSCMLEENDCTSTFCYGPDEGDLDFRKQLATFLTEQYGDTTIHSDNLIVTAGATQALHMVSTILFNAHCPVFMEDPTYFAAYNMIHKDLSMEVVPVPTDDDGIDAEALDRLLTANRPKWEGKTSRPYWALVYTIPVYNNPTGSCYTPSRCRRLVELARKHNVLVVAEDVYNLIHFGDSCPPKRLLAYDDPADPEYKGHVLSSGTFSKILAPGLRLGWVEGPEHILSRLHGSFFMMSGGSPNHYASKVAASALKMGLQTQHLKYVRGVYKKRRDTVCKVLRENLPQGSTFLEPQGGFFVWVKFPEGTDVMELVSWTVKKYHIFYLPGICSSIEGKHGHCARLSFCFHSEEVLADLFTTLCKAAKEFLAQGAH